MGVVATLVRVDQEVTKECFKERKRGLPFFMKSIPVMTVEEVSHTTYRSGSVTLQRERSTKESRDWNRTARVGAQERFSSSGLHVAIYDKGWSSKLTAIPCAPSKRLR